MAFLCNPNTLQLELVMTFFFLLISFQGLSGFPNIVTEDEFTKLCLLILFVYIKYVEYKQN